MLEQKNRAKKMMTPSLKILTVANVPPDPNSGAAGSIYFTNVALRELGHQVDEIWNDELPQKIKHGNLHSLMEQPKNYRNAILKRLKTNDYDVIQISQPQGYLAAKTLKKMNFPGLVINRSHGLELHVNAVVPYWHKKLGIAESTFPRSLLTPILRSLLERQWKQVVRWNDGILFGAHQDREFLINRFQHLPECDPQKIRTIHHAASDFFLETDVPLKTDTQLSKILYVGQHSFIKAPHIQVEIINRVLKSSPKTQMTWVTAQSAHDWIQQQLSPQVRNQVTLQSWVPQEKLIDLYDQHGVFIFPSFFEGFGKAFLEAMTRGLCVVASDVGGMHDLIAHENNGFLCEPGNVEQFEQTLTQLLNHPEKIKACGEQAIQSTKQCSWNEYAIQLVQFYRDLQEIGRSK